MIRDATDNQYEMTDVNIVNINNVNTSARYYY
jgi:hypothetical protein